MSMIHVYLLLIFYLHILEYIKNKEINITGRASNVRRVTTTSEILSSKQVHVEVSLIIPVYREEKKVLALLRKAKEIASSLNAKCSSSCEIIVVNDGSDDNTLEVLLKEEKKDPTIRVISYDINKGKGYAVRKGISSSNGKEVIFMDGDLDVHPIAIQEYIEGLQNHDLIIGSKSHPLSQIHAPLSRRFLSSVFNILVRYALRINLRDTQTGLKGGKGNILRNIFKVMVVNRYAFDVELLTVATFLNLSIKEVPVMISYSNNLKLSEIIKMFLDLIAISYRYKIKGSYQKKMSTLTTIE